MPRAGNPPRLHAFHHAQETEEDDEEDRVGEETRVQELSLSLSLSLSSSLPSLSLRGWCGIFGPRTAETLPSATRERAPVLPPLPSPPISLSSARSRAESREGLLGREVKREGTRTTSSCASGTDDDERAGAHTPHGSSVCMLLAHTAAIHDHVPIGAHAELCAPWGPHLCICMTA